MTELKKIAGAKTFLLIGDSKLISYDNVAAITGQECTFLAPASRTYVKAAALAACDLAQATEVSYAAQRDAHKDPGQRGRWHVLQDSRPFQIRNPKRKGDPAITLRRIFVHSSARATAAATSRAKKLARAREDLDRLVRGLGGRFYPDEKAVTGRLQQIAAARKAGPYLRYTVSTAPDTTPAAGTAEAAGIAGRHRWQGTGSGGSGKPALSRRLDQDAIDAAAATDGWYPLPTNPDPRITPPAGRPRDKR